MNLNRFIDGANNILNSGLGLRYARNNLPAGQALARHMKGSNDSHVVSSHVCRSSVKATSTHSPDCGFGCFDAQKPEYQKS